MILNQNESNLISDSGRYVYMNPKCIVVHMFVYMCTTCITIVQVTQAVSSIIVIYVLMPKKKDNIYVRFFFFLQILNKYSVFSLTTSWGINKHMDICKPNLFG